MVQIVYCVRKRRGRAWLQLRLDSFGEILISKIWLGSRQPRKQSVTKSDVRINRDRNEVFYLIMNDEYHVLLQKI